MIPVLIFQMWFCTLLSVGLLAGVIDAAREWQQRSWTWDPGLQQSVFAPHWGWNEETAIFALAVALGLIVLFGRTLVQMCFRLLHADGTGADSLLTPAPESTHTLQRADGTRLHVECFGPADAPPMILSHGWTLDGSAWKYFIRAMAGRFRLIVWDQPGLGRSTRPSDRNYSLEKLAHDLAAVLDLAKGRPAVLVGHSIGGMIVLTFCRLFGAKMTSRVTGLVLTHTTPTNPVRTTSGAAFYTAIENPVLKPLMYLTIALSPLLWVANWLSYRNGTAHLSVMSSSFAGTQTWEQVDFAARFMPKASPAVIARGMLGMMHYDASAVLDDLDVPVLVVAGDRDTLTKPEASAWMESAIPQTQLITLSPAKHLGHLEHNATYAAAVENFARTRCGAISARGPELASAYHGRRP